VRFYHDVNPPRVVLGTAHRDAGSRLLPPCYRPAPLASPKEIDRPHFRRHWLDSHCADVFWRRCSQATDRHPRKRRDELSHKAALSGVRYGACAGGSAMRESRHIARLLGASVS
jgi:hypothetical protein